MAHIFTKVTIAEISADQNISKIVHENNFNLINVAFGGTSRAEAEELRLKSAKQTRQLQALEDANVCNLTDAQNTRRDLDEWKGRAERAEEANLCNLTDARNAKQTLEEQKRINAELNGRVNRERILLAALVALFVIHLLAPRTGLLLLIPWLAGACVVYMPHLWQRGFSLRFTAMR
jgi:hypothetical protein